MFAAWRRSTYRDGDSLRRHSSSLLATGNVPPTPAEGGEPADDRHQPAGAGKDYEELPPAFHRSIVTPDRSDAATDVPPGSPDRRPPPASRTLANDRAGAGASAHGSRRNPHQAASGPDASSRKCPSRPHDPQRVRWLRMLTPATDIPCSAAIASSRAVSSVRAPVHAAPAVRPVRRPTG